MFNTRDPLIPSDRPPEREAPEKVQIFVLRHSAFFLLVGVMLVQLLLLSAQITRNQKVRLIQVWAVALIDPFERALHSITESVEGTWRNYRGLFAAHEQNQALHVQLTNARAEIHRLSQQAEESRRLRELLELKNQLPFQTVAAEVIAKSPGNASQAVYIDKGEDAGIVADAAVITPEGVVGKIIAVFPRSAQVLLITDTSSGVAAALSESRVQGIVKGTGRNACELEYIMKETPVVQGEPILTSGLDRIYPKGLLIGNVTEVAEGNIYKEIKTRPAAPLNRLESVLVVANPTPSGIQAGGTAPRP